MIATHPLDFCRRATSLGALVLVILALGATRGEAAAVGAYTNEQASRGAAVYTQYWGGCSSGKL
jgi:hypothetical protein